MTSLSEPALARSRASLGAWPARVGAWLASRSTRFHVGLVLVTIIVGAVVLADVLPFSDPYLTYRGFELKGPSWQFPLGTDEIGRDLLARIVYGGRPTLIAAFSGVLIAALIGVPLGLVSGLVGGFFDNATGRIADATFALPTILIGVGLAAALGGGLLAVTIAIVIGSWPAFVRIARAGALQEKALPYVEALRSLGASRTRIVFRHILPNAIGPILVQFTVALAIAVLIESGLSFLGMGAQPPAPSWGGLLSDSRRFLRTAAYYAVFPGLAISMLVIGINFIADELSGEGAVSSRVRRARRAAALGQAPEALLGISDLRASFGGRGGRVPVLNGVELTLPKGEILGIVGESGSGKSVTMFTVTGLNRRQDVAVESGAAWLLGEELLAMPEGRLRARRGRDIGMVFQNPAAALNPIKPVGWQIEEALASHARPGERGAIAARAVALLRAVQLPDPETIGRRYPHELSGGQRQRVVIAMAVANQPALIIADEPTTALDVTVQAQVLDLLKTLAARPDASLAIITHDLGVVAEVADHVAVMYYGRVVENGPVARIFASPAHPYTRGLLASIPRLDRRVTRFRAIAGAPPRPGEIKAGCAFLERCELSRGRPECRTTVPPLRRLADSSASACHFAEELAGMGVPDPAEDVPEPAGAPAAVAGAAPLLAARGVEVVYRGRDAKPLIAVNGVDLDVRPGTALGIVGESGCGKSSLLRALMNLPAPTAGEVSFDGKAYGAMSRDEQRRLRLGLQIVQQDPSTALDRRMRVIEIVREALDIHRIGTAAERQARARDYLRRVGIGDDLTARRPSELSGGQQQRVAIARALVLHPRMLFLDEAFSALDVSVRAQVLNLLDDLRREFGLTYVFVSHDLSVIRSVADEVAIMYLGRVVERGSNEEIFCHPSHPYTEALLSAVPVADPAAARARRRVILKGDPPNPADPPSGCAFRTRCFKAQAACAAAVPELHRRTRQGGAVACFFPIEDAGGASDTSKPFQTHQQ